jgi:hypothetical protein
MSGICACGECIARHGDPCADADAAGTVACRAVWRKPCDADGSHADVGGDTDEIIKVRAAGAAAAAAQWERWQQCSRAEQRGGLDLGGSTSAYSAAA